MSGWMSGWMVIGNGWTRHKEEHWVYFEKKEGENLFLKTFPEEK